MTAAFSLKGVLRRAEKKPCFSLPNTSVFRGAEGWGEIRGGESELGAQGHVVDASSQILAPGQPRGSAWARRPPPAWPRPAPRRRSARPGAARSPRPGPRARKVGTTRGAGWHPQLSLALAEGGWGPAREEGAGEALGLLGFY